MRAFLWMCACLMMCFSVSAKDFFDYSDEQGMLARFRDFQTRKVSAIRQLAKYGVFDKRVGQENIMQAKSLAQRLWFDITQQSVPFDKLTIEQSDYKRVLSQFWKFRSHYQPVQERGELNEVIVNYLTLFSRLEWIIRDDVE